MNPKQITQIPTTDLIAELVRREWIEILSNYRENQPCHISIHPEVYKND